MALSKILVVEDERIIAEDIRENLERLGYAVPGVAASGEEAIRKAVEMRPDLVIMAIRLKGEMDGITVAEKINQRLAVPVIYLTAFADDSTLQRAKKTQPFGYLIKPFKEKELHATIEVALYKHGMEMQLKRLQKELLGKVEELESQESERRRREALQLAQFRVREAVWKMQRAEDIDLVMEVIRECVRMLGIESLGIGVNLVEEGGEGTKVQFHSLGERGEQIESWPDSGKELIVRTWRERIPAYRRDIQTEDEYGERGCIKKQFGPVRSVLDVPFSHGTLAINSREPDVFSKEDIAALQALADVLSEGYRRLQDLDLLEIKEVQLRQSQKMEAIGQLAGGVAHDFNNLVTVITGYCQLLRKGLAAEDARQQHIEEIERSGEQAAAMIRQLLAFSHRQVVESKVLDLNQVLAGVGKMLGRLIGEDIEMVWALGTVTGKVEADPGQLEQVIMNLAINARDAMPEGGELIIETTDVELDQEYAERHLEVQPGPYVLLAVSDTGVGMDAETQARIFEPFFTTKEEKGTGLGLATVYGIVKQSGGHIWVYSEPGKGSTFKVYLPRVEREAKRVSCAAVGVGVGGGDETILVVEDNQTVRKLVQRILEDWGYKVLVAQQGEEALQICARREGAIDLLLTDVVMPGMNGCELAEYLTAMRSEMKVIFMSGYADRAAERYGLLRGERPYVQKPFTPQELIHEVRVTLDTPQPVV